MMGGAFAAEVWALGVWAKRQEVVWRRVRKPAVTGPDC